MSHDLIMGRATEIDALQGQVVRMGAKLGKATPINQRVAEIVAIAELANASGFKTGIVSTASVTDATPAAFTAHISYRLCENPDIVEKVEYKGIELGGCPQDAIKQGGPGAVSEQLANSRLDVILGGGMVLDPAAPGAGKAQPQRMVYLNAMTAASVTQALSELMAQHQLVNLDQFGQSCNLLPEDVGELVVAAGRPFIAEGTHWMASVERWRNTRQEVLGVVDKWHASRPELAGIKVADIQSALAGRVEPTLLMAVITDQLQHKELALNEGRISRSSFTPIADAQSAAHWDRVEQLLRRCGNTIPLLSQISEQLGIEQAVVEQIMKAAVKRGQVHKLSGRRYALPRQLYTLATLLLAARDEGVSITVITMKNHFDTGRNLTVEILEYFDEIRFTARRDNERVVLNPELPAQLFNG